MAVKTNINNNAKYFIQTKEAAYWIVTAVSSVIFFLISNIICKLDSTKGLKPYQDNASALMGAAFGLTISALFELYRHFKNNDGNRIGLVFLGKLFGIAAIVAETIVFTFCNTIEKMNYANHIFYISIVFAISAFIFGYSIKWVVWKKEGNK